MLGILTNDPKDTFALDDLAFVADFSNGALNLHRLFPFHGEYSATAQSHTRWVSSGDNVPG